MLENLDKDHKSKVSTESMEKILDQIADRWKDNLWGRWRAVMNDSWDNLTKTNIISPALLDIPDLTQGSLED
ncbi:MAG: hypothetical protein Q4G69_10190 [Planctomycetia bacterium]|nr:hypothetical protein [Planctomycetia bacterium]